MKRPAFLLILIFANGCSTNSPDCKCQASTTLKTVRAENFLKIDKYDSPAFAPDSLYSLPKEQNRLLWFRDIESIDTTKFTTYWNDYAPNNYHASNKDFIDYYTKEKKVELAFQLGPGGMMWSYFSFVVKKVDCCYVITSTSFVHARFRNKSYAILNSKQFQKLKQVLEPFSNNPIPQKEEYGYHGHFIDSQKEQPYFIDFDHEMDEKTQKLTKKTNAFFHFIDDSIRWVDTYKT